MKSFILAAVFCFSVLSTGYAQTEKEFGSIVVRFGFGAPPRNEHLIDFDSTFAWVGGDARDFGTNANPGLFVYSKPLGRWLQIAKVSTAGGKFGKSSQLVQAQWNFTGFASKDFVPLPILSIVPHYPDKVTFDEARETFVLHFDSFNTLESERTTVLVPKKDLTEAFDYYAKAKFNTPNKSLEPTRASRLGSPGNHRLFDISNPRGSDLIR
jgi:hypothetical protein